MWEKIKSRSHRPLKVFPFGPNSSEVMIFGSVEYEFKAGGSNGLEWAARGVLETDDGRVVWSDYQVFLVRDSCRWVLFHLPRREMLITSMISGYRSAAGKIDFSSFAPKFRRHCATNAALINDLDKTQDILQYFSLSDSYIANPSQKRSIQDAC